MHTCTTMVSVINYLFVIHANFIQNTCLLLKWHYFAIHIYFPYQLFSVLFPQRSQVDTMKSHFSMICIISSALITH